VPSTLQAGVAELDLRLWSATVRARATPDAILERLAKEVSQIIALSEVRERLGGLGVDPGAP
jgi:hypothetical protein